MNKRQQAPGDLELVRAFVNTADIEQQEDQIGRPTALAAWLAEHGLAAADAGATGADVQHAIDLREALRAVLLAHNAGPPAPAEACETLDAAARRARVRLRFGAGATATLAPEAQGVDAALGRLLAIVHAAIAQGTWMRLKACREHTCEWAFYDHTKNRSGAWCNMRVCGNRVKARAFRERHAANGTVTESTDEVA